MWSSFIADSDDIELAQIGFVFVTISGIVALIITLIVWARWDTSRIKSRNTSESSREQSEEESEKEPPKPNPFRKISAKTSKAKSRDVLFDHPWMITTLKGHVGRVLDVDFSSNGKFLVSVGEDRSLFLWHTKDFAEKEHKFTRGNVELDNATRIAFGPDSKSVLLSLAAANKLAVYKLARREDGSQAYKFFPVENVSFPEVHLRDINSNAIACNGKFVMSSSDDNKMVLYNLRGDILKIVEPKLNILYEASISPCGRFVAASGFTPDVFVFEVLFNRQGEFVDVKRAFELKGHTSGVLSFCFNQNSSRCATASKDGTWKLFDTEIRYNLGQEAQIIASGDWDVLRNASPETVSVAMSPSGKSFAVGASRHVRIFSALQPEKQFNLMLDLHQTPLCRVRMSPCGLMLATCGDRHIRIFHNVAEYFSSMVALEKAVRDAREEAPRRRLQEQLEEAKDKLQAVYKQ
uniref:Transducin beta-like protein 2 n=2 Tax=Parascaris univalens TaxID=6257 RepID=A0A915ASE8_PARUN